MMIGKRKNRSKVNGVNIAVFRSSGTTGPPEARNDVYEVCSVCNTETAVHRDMPISQRQHYIKACGQL